MKCYLINQWLWDWDFWGEYTIADISIYKDPFPSKYSLQVVLLGIGFIVEWGH